MSISMDMELLLHKI